MLQHFDFSNLLAYSQEALVKPKKHRKGEEMKLYVSPSALIMREPEREEVQEAEIELTALPQKADFAIVGVDAEEIVSAVSALGGAKVIFFSTQKPEALMMRLVFEQGVETILICQVIKGLAALQYLCMLCHFLEKR